MKTKKLLFYLLAGLLAGCVPVMSLHPLYTDKDLVFEEKLLGTWVDDPNNPETTWEFKRVADEPKRNGQFKRPEEQEKAYELIFSDNEGKKGSFFAHLVKLENKLFLDVYPSEPPWDEADPNKVDWVYNTLFLVPVHTFIKINGIEPQLKLQLTDDDELEKLLKEDPNAVEYTSIDNQPILTASTKELQAFVLKYADDDRLFTDEAILIRKEVHIEPNDIAPNESPKANDKNKSTDQKADRAG